MRVLRLENSNGYGPFMARGNWRYNLLHTNDTQRFPVAPNKDCRHFRHACTTMDKLFAWFPLDAMEEVRDEFGIAEYEIEPDTISYKDEVQIQFVFAQAKKLCWIPLSELVS